MKTRQADLLCYLSCINEFVCRIEVQYQRHSTIQCHTQHVSSWCMTQMTLQDSPTNLCQPVLGQLVDIIIVSELRIVRMYCNDLVILLALINHLHYTNWLGAQERHGDDWCLHQDQDILNTSSFHGIE